MQNKCNKCGKENSEDAKFCAGCGEILGLDAQPSSSSESSESESDKTPAEQAAAIADVTKQKVGHAKKKARAVWKSFSRNERMIAVGAILGFVAFFLPWIKMVVPGESIEVGTGFAAAKEFKYLFLVPLSMLVSLVLLYFSQGASDIIKIKKARLHMLLGTVWLTLGVVNSIAIKELTEMLNEFIGMFGDFSISFSFGWWLLLIAMTLLIVGAFRSQNELLKKKETE